MLSIKLLAVFQVYIPRLLSPLILYINPTLGIISIIYLDWCDRRMLKGMGISMKTYTLADKIIDTINYLVMFVYAAATFPQDIVAAMGILLIYRIIGVVLFLFRPDRRLFFYFASVYFSFFCLYVLFGNIWDARLILMIAIIFQYSFEYIHHVGSTRTTEEQLENGYSTQTLNYLEKFLRRVINQPQ